MIKSQLEAGTVGQRPAINAVVRGVTRVVSGMTPQERSFCAYMLMGPSGTGKSHLIGMLARVIHGDERRVVVADCTQFVHGDPWMVFAAQLAPLFDGSVIDHGASLREAPPLSIVRIEYLERGPEEISRGLGVALETGQLVLPEGRRGSLRNCLVFLTSTLCSKEILDEAPRIGFSGAQDDDDEEMHDRIYETCRQQAEQRFGGNLIGRLDALVVFHRFQHEHLSEILDHRLDRLNAWLAPRRIRCSFLPAAKVLLLERGGRDLRLGARALIRTHQRLVEFPLADMMLSGRIVAGTHVRIDRRNADDYLHFDVTEDRSAATSIGAREVPVSWASRRASATPRAGDSRPSSAH
ncbi:MAG TPA: AAA family ATPase [Candidatus Polarisedimenticolaceae bacterium]|nr:AAA family ATPase [Candidatus Polarisedimenticolaceae bacterium]